MPLPNPSPITNARPLAADTPTAMPMNRRNADIVSIVLLVLLGVVIIRAGIRSGIEIAEVNDFEVFYRAGEVAVERGASLYDFVSPVKQRGPFLYPPAAGIFFIPLTWLPHDASGVIFSITKTIALVVLLWGVVCFTPHPPTGRDQWWVRLLLIFLILVALYRPMDSDVGNGQVNIHVAALAAAGIWLMMMTRRGWIIGSVLLGLATALKMTPLLFLAVPFLARKWNATTAGTAGIALCVLIVPAFWYGWSEARELTTQHSSIMRGIALEPRDQERQSTMHEVVMFTLAGLRSAGDDAQWIFRANNPHRVVDGSLVPDRLPDPVNVRAASMIWLAIGVAGGVLFLVGRWMLVRRGAAITWQWDFAMLACATIMLSPQVRKAHLVILIIPAGYVAAQLARGWWRSKWADQRSVSKARLWWMSAGAIAFAALMLAAEDLSIPAPGFPLPYQPGMFIALIVLIWLVVESARLDRAERIAPLPQSSQLRVDLRYQKK